MACWYAAFSQETDTTAKVADTTHSTDTARKAAADSIHHRDTVRYYLNYAATGMINKANSSNAYVFNNAVRLNISRKSASANVYASWIYGEQQKNLTNNDFSSGLDFNLYTSLRHFYYWGLATYNTSFSLKINGQLQAGLGIGYNVIDRKTANLNLSDGLLYEKGDLYDVMYDVNGADVYQRDVYEVVRNSFRLRFHWAIKNFIVLDGTEFFQHSLASAKDYIVRSSQSMSLKLNKWLSFTTSLTYNKVSRTGSENLLLNFGLTVDKHF